MGRTKTSTALIHVPVILQGRLTTFPSPYCIRKKYPVLQGLKEQQNLVMCYGKSLKNATKRRNFDHVQKFKILDCATTAL